MLFLTFLCYWRAYSKRCRYMKVTCPSWKGWFGADKLFYLSLPCYPFAHARKAKARQGQQRKASRTRKIVLILILFISFLRSPLAQAGEEKEKKLVSPKRDGLGQKQAFLALASNFPVCAACNVSKESKESKERKESKESKESTNKDTRGTGTTKKWQLRPF